MLEYPRWKYILIAVVLLVALVFALPNVFGSAPALQLAHKDHSPVTAADAASVESYLRAHGVKFVDAYIDHGRLMLQFAGVPEQLQGRDVADAMPQSPYVSALSFVPLEPAILRAVGLKPMPLGLDLRGGLELLYQVDVNSAVTQMLQGYSQDAARALAAAKIPVRNITFAATSGSAVQNAIRIDLAPQADVGAARKALSSPLQGLTITAQSSPEGPQLIAVVPPAMIKQREDYAIEQNITTLRNRVNQLGVSEPVVTRQGMDRIDVQLPGIQDPADVKNLLGRVATLEFRLNDTQANPIAAAQTGDVPLGDKLYTHTPNGMPLLLKREVIATGDQLTNATVGQSQNGGPAVDVVLNSKAGQNMLRITRQNVGKPMAVVLIEKQQETSTVNGKKVTREVTSERVINDATIQGVFGDRFEITGLTLGEAQDLSILLRSGSLSAPIALVSQNVIGPSLGKENIKMGITALIIGMAGVLIFMAIYYKLFGLVADLVLIANVVLLTALLSMMHASLSLPGIAGIILTVGIAVDANVLIYERIREEIRKGVTPQAAIRAGFEKAFSAIADSNITTLIAGLVLWVFGTGAIRGFAVVLTLGIATSMFTSLMGSRALVTLMYGRKRKVARLPI